MTSAVAAPSGVLTGGQVTRVIMLVGAWAAGASLLLPWVVVSDDYTKEPTPGSTHGLWLNAESINGFHPTGPGMALVVLVGTLTVMVLAHRIAVHDARWTSHLLFLGAALLVLVTRLVVDIPEDRTMHLFGVGWSVWPLGVGIVALGAAADALLTEARQPGYAG